MQGVVRHERILLIPGIILIAVLAGVGVVNTEAIVVLAAIAMSHGQAAGLPGGFIGRWSACLPRSIS